jgi:BirA family biotin operon repressor/biotin-[acetyl-CoA-carboxylase] ligase
VSLALQVQYSLPAEIKWPNDVLIKGRKVCGVLAEAHWAGDRLSHVILGAGVNVAASALPAETSLNLPATSLETELGHPLDRLEVLYHVLAEIMAWRSRVMEAAFLGAWESHLAYKGQAVRFSPSNRGDPDVPDGLTGTLLGLDPTGGLKLKIQGGDEVILRNGSISQVNRD